MGAPLPAFPLVAARGDEARGRIEQFYTTAIGLLPPLADGILDAAIAAARERWGGEAELVLDTQVARLRPGQHPGLPVWSAAPSAPGGEVMLACLGNEALLEIGAADGHTPERDGPVELAPCDGLIALRSGCAVRFRAATCEQTVAVVLLRRALPGQALNRRRSCARLFVPPPVSCSGELPEWARAADLTFHSGCTPLAPLPAFTEQDIADEPLFEVASAEHARTSGGPIMRAFLERLPANWLADEDLVIGVKRDELSPGWYPALLEWHMDGSSRAARRLDGTPDLRAPVRRQEQIAACVGQVAPTAILAGTLRLPEAPLDTPGPQVRDAWAQCIARHITSGAVQATTAPSNQVFTFPWGGFHACSPADRPGWRCFIKAMRGRGELPVNRRSLRSTIAWPSTAEKWPSDPFGIFPTHLPVSPTQQLAAWQGPAPFSD